MTTAEMIHGKRAYPTSRRMSAKQLAKRDAEYARQEALKQAEGKAKRFYAMGPNCWGIGQTFDAAVKEAKKNWPSFIKPRGKVEHFSVWWTDSEEINVSEFDGSFSVPAGFVIEKIQTSTLAKK